VHYYCNSVTDFYYRTWVGYQKNHPNTPVSIDVHYFTFDGMQYTQTNFIEKWSQQSGIYADTMPYCTYPFPGADEPRQ